MRTEYSKPSSKTGSAQAQWWRCQQVGNTSHILYRFNRFKAEITFFTQVFFKWKYRMLKNFEENPGTEKPTGSHSTFEFPSQVNFLVPVCTVSPGHRVNNADTQ